jgi:hypothetical protein
MEILRIAGYLDHEKLAIARQYLLPRQIEANGLKKEEVILEPNVLTAIMRGYTREAGVRELERRIARVSRKLARKRAEVAGATTIQTVRVDDLKELLGTPPFDPDDTSLEDKVGVASGLAYTSAGGEVLEIEVSVVKGRGKVQLTGTLGDVMKESASAALSYARARARALGIESESDDVRKNMVKRLERQKIQTAFKNMRDAGIRSFAFFIFGYPGESPKTMEQTIEYAIDLDPDFANFYPAVPYPGTALYEKCIRESLLPSEAMNDWSKMEYSYYLLRGNGLDERVVMEAINRAKRRFFLRPGYMARHVGDVAQIAFSKQNIVWQVLTRTLFGAPVIDTSTAAPERQSAAVE